MSVREPNDRKKSGPKPRPKKQPAIAEQAATARAVEDGAIEVAAQGFTDQGRVRKNNEDNLAACDLSTAEVLSGPFELRRRQGPGGFLWLVADGMGGEACGELASRMCSELLPKQLLLGLGGRQNLQRAEIASLLCQAVEVAGDAILVESRSQKSCRGMGTTATAAVCYGSYLLVAQVGDSRAYLIRNGQMIQLTRDQTFLNYLVEMGAADPGAESSNDPRRSILIQAVGSAEKLHVALSGVELCRGDRLLLTSDGLTNMLKPEEILGIAAGDGDLAGRGRKLIAAANVAGGLDNITLILAELSGNGLRLPAPTTPVHVETLNADASSSARRPDARQP